MNIERRSGRIAGWLVLSFFVAMIALSCKKSGPTIAVVSVVDSTGSPVAAASVTLWQDTVTNSTNGVQAKVRETKSSDAAGRAEFNFDLEAFLNVEVIKNADTGKSFVRLKEHETVEVTVHL